MVVMLLDEDEGDDEYIAIMYYYIVIIDLFTLLLFDVRIVEVLQLYDIVLNDDVVEEDEVVIHLESDEMLDELVYVEQQFLPVIDDEVVIDVYTDDEVEVLEKTDKYEIMKVLELDDVDDVVYKQIFSEAICI